MNWSITSGDILDEPADVLVCSANIFLNLSGGVGGEILLRGGRGMQDELHQYLTRSGKRFVQQGDVVVTAPHGLPLKAVLHAVAVDGFYQTSPEIVRSVVEKSLRIAASLGAKQVSLTALATGFGRLPMARFAQAIAPLGGLDFPPIERVVVCVRNEDDREQLRAAFAAAARRDENLRRGEE
jgi:O-acetyl-ADP-ribose deacetylase (regulator of RNase III)